jgi:hypothetical protein
MTGSPQSGEEIERKIARGGKITRPFSVPRGASEVSGGYLFKQLILL